jgi:hypothetical protein
VDRREQKKQAAQHEAEMLRQLRSSQGVAETKEDRRRDREREALADSYDGFDMRVRACVDVRQICNRSSC